MRCCTLLLVLAACLPCFGLANAQEAAANSSSSYASVFDALEARSFKLFSGMLPAISFGADDIPSNLTFTLLVPTDKAITSFLASMGLSYRELLERPALIDALLSTHIIPGRKLTGKYLTPGSRFRLARTLDNETLIFKRQENGSLTVQDLQEHVAAVGDNYTVLDQSVIHAVDRVLMNGKVFYTSHDFLLFYPAYSTLAKLVAAAGLDSAFRANTFNNTVFAPDNAALARAAQTGPLPTGEALVQLLGYHVVPGSRSLPANFTEGQPLPTLFKGHNLNLKFDSVLRQVTINGSTMTLNRTIASVVPEAGPAANVTRPNIFAGRATIHGIDGVLLPAAQKTSAGSSDNATAATGQTNSSGGRRRGLSWQLVTNGLAAGGHRASGTSADMAGRRLLITARDMRGHGNCNGDNDDSNGSCNDEPSDTTIAMAEAAQDAGSVGVVDSSDDWGE